MAKQRRQSRYNARRFGNKSKWRWNGTAPPQCRRSTEAPAADCDPIADLEITPLIDHAAQQHQVDAKLIRGVIEQESGFHACAVSSKGAKGLMQLMPATIEQFKVDDAFDPSRTSRPARRIPAIAGEVQGRSETVLAAYNAGPGSVDKAGGIPDIKETQDYVEGVMKKMK